jgi:predicted PhzF superfamily epimerase YddE/YHI9
VELGVELEVVHTETNVVAFVATPVQGRLFHPWERVETPKFAAPHFEGWRPAYTRKRIEATVYRSYDEENELPWRVFDGRTKSFRDVATTKAACELTKAMRQGLTL